MIRSLLFDPRTGDATAGGVEQIEPWREDNELVLWLDIGSEPPEVERRLLEDFEIHPLAIQDALRSRHPPKVEQFEHYLFILLRGLYAQPEGLDYGAIQLALFIGGRFLITRHNKDSLSANWLYDQVVSGQYEGDQTPGALAIQLSNRLVRRYVQLLLDVEPRLDDIEDEMYSNPHDKLLQELTTNKARLRQLSRTANYHKHIVLYLQRESSIHISDNLKHEIIDLYEQVERSGSLAALYYEVARDLTDAYLALSSHRLNNVMQILTVFTVIFVPLTFLAGIYGMNFQNMPELESRFGYFILLGIMLVMGVAQLIYFKRKDWV